MTAISTRLKLHRILTLDYKLDAISFSLFIFNALLSVYLVVVSINVGLTDIAWKSVLMLLLTMVGLLGYMVTFRKFPAMDNLLTPGELSGIIASSLIGFIFVLILQTTVLRGYATIYGALGIFGTKLLLFNIAVGEEFFFRFFIQSALTRTLSVAVPPQQAAIGAIGVSSVGMTIFHYVYHGMPAVLLAVFVSSLVLGTVYAVTRRLSVPAIVHIAVNMM